MSIADKKKLLLVMGISLIFSMAGCVDTSVQPIPSSIIYHSQLKFVNLVADGGTATLTLNGQSIGTANFGSEVPGSSASFMDVQAGSKTLNVSFSSNAPSKVFKFSADTDYKIRIFIAGSDSSNDVYKNAERYIWQTKDSKNGASIFPADTGWIAFFNGSPDATLDTIQITGGGVDSTVTPGLDLGSAIPYMKFKSGSYAIKLVYSNADTSLSTTINQDLQAKGKYTTVIYDSLNTLKTEVLTDD